MACAILGILYAFFLYSKDKKLVEFSKPLVAFLAFIRAFLVTILAALLLAPLIAYQTKRIEKPEVLILQDNSESIALSKDSSLVRSKFQEQLGELQDKLSEKYEVRSLLFDESLRPMDSVPDYSGKLTSFQNLFEAIEQGYQNGNLGALVLASDGLYNQGLNPLYISAAKQVPIYGIALGDSASRMDLSIQDLRNNELSYLGNRFPIEIDILAKKAQAKKSRVKVLKNGKVLWEESFELRKQQEVLSFSASIEAKEAGLQRFDVVVESLDQEANTENNRKSFYVDVLDGRLNVLLLAAAPHPDLAAIKEAILKNKNYQVKSELIKNFKGDLKQYNLVILHQLPTATYPIAKLIAELKQEKIGSWFILGPQTLLNRYNQLNTAVKVQRKGNAFNEVQADFNTAFPLFNLTEEELTLIKQFPPLQAPLADYELAQQAYPHFYQKIGRVSTQDPLLCFQQIDGNKTASLLAQGIWKWRMANYQMRSNHEVFDKLISKIVQFLALRADKSYFRLNHAQAFYENESITFEAQLFNQSYELVNEAELNIQLSDENGKEYDFTFSRNQNAYTLEIPSLPVGNYNYEAKVSLGGNNYAEKGEFSVKELQLEAAQTIANHNLMYQLSQESGGKLFYPNQLQELEDNLLQNKELVEQVYYEEKYEEFIELKWLFFVFLTLVSLEWFLRKRNGAF